MEIKGIDMEAGLSSVNGEEEVYNDILQIYYEDGVEMLGVLKQNLQHTDLQLFITHTHGLKSASKGIGANEVSERFKEMEFAGKDGDMARIDDRLPSCLEEFEELLANIKKHLDGGSAGGEDAATATLKKMKAFLEDMDTDVFEELLGDLEKNESDSARVEKLREIRVAYDDYDFAQTITIIDSMI